MGDPEVRGGGARYLTREEADALLTALISQLDTRYVRREEPAPGEPVDCPGGLLDAMNARIAELEGRNALRRNAVHVGHYVPAARLTAERAARERAERERDEYRQQNSVPGILRVIEAPGTWPLGAPGSNYRRAQELGQRLQVAEMALAEARDANARVVAERDEARKRVEELSVEMSCDVCGGDGKTASGLPCMCGGTGSMVGAARRLRETVYDLEKERAALRAQLAEARAIVTAWQVADHPVLATVRIEIANLARALAERKETT